MKRLERLKSIKEENAVRRGYLLLAPVLLLIVWQLSSTFRLVNPLFLPGPWDVLKRLVELCMTGDILPDIGATLMRVIASFVIAIVIGTPVGMLMGYFRKVYYALEFVVDFFRSIPATALFPLFLLFFGIGNTAKIAIAVWGCVLVIIVNSMYGVKHANKLRLRAAKTYKAQHYRLFRRVVLPEALPEIITGYRLGVSMCMVIVVVVEMFIGTTVGLGHRILNAQLVYNIPEMYSAIVIAGLFGYIINKIFICFEKKVVHWGGR